MGNSLGMAVAERKLKILLFVRGQFLKGRCECLTIFTTPLVDDL